MNETQQKFLEKARKSIEVARQINESDYHDIFHLITKPTWKLISTLIENVK